MTTTKTYILFLTPGILFGDETIKEVASRDISFLEIPSNVYMFYFFDQIETIIDGQVLKSNSINVSPNYYPNARIMTTEEVEKEVPNNKTLLFNMGEENKIIKCQPGNFQFYDENAIIYQTIVKRDVNFKLNKQ